MWNLVHRTLGPSWLLPVYYRDALVQAVTSMIDRVTAARRARWQIGKHLEELTQQGYEQSPQFQEMMAARARLDAEIEQVLRGLTEQDESLARELGERNPLPTLRNFAGIEPLGPSTLGPASGVRPGLISRGPEVIKLQKFLRAAGFQLEVSGTFDPPTRQVLQKFQAEYELPPSPEGIVGSDTRKLINEILEGR